MLSKCLKSPISRMGGKHLLRNWIAEKIPKHKVFAEVFCGSCVVSLTKEPSGTTIANDIDSHLIKFWRALQDTVQRTRLIALLDGMLYSRAAWDELRARWKKNTIPDDPVTASAEWFFLNRATYAADVQHGGFVGYTQGRNMCKTFRNTVEQLNKVGEMVKGWIIENLDYKTCITRFDSPSTVFYCDMPYYLPGKRDCYQDSFTLDDHKALAELLRNIEGRALVSHYRDDTISKLYEGWNCFEFESFKGSSNSDSKPITTEVVFTNYKPVGQTRPLFQVV